MAETNRLEKLKQDVKSREGSFVPDMNPMWRDVALYRLKWFSPNSSRLQWRAANMAELAQIVPIMINPHWSLAGEHLNPFLSVVWGLRSNLSLEEKQRQLAAIGYEDCYDAIMTLENTYFSEQSGTAPGEVLEELWDGHPASDEYNEVFWSHGWKENHSIRNYAMLLRDGYGGLRKRLETELAAHPITAADYPLRENFLRGAMFICDAGLTIGHRYAKLAATMAAETEDESERRRLQNMAECSRLTVENGATDFHDAVQLLWFGHLITCAEDGINANSLGRIDQFLYPWYRQDIDAGRITREDAVELMIELALKLYLDYDVQAITLGGCDSTGKCAVNELSYVILEATEYFGELRDLAVRISSDTPVEFLRACSRLVIRGGGIPFFFNDECFIPALSERGIAQEDARDYAPIGCVELTIPGKTNPHAVSGWFNLAKCLELTLFNGVDPVNDVQMGPTTGALSDFRDFNAFYQAFQQQVEYFASRMIYHCRRGELCQRQFAPLPGWSLLTDDC
ncbi:MAG: pyruvate formate lyase family protein, partial [Victivallales bacterium]|nr:pyruvate formate lyase family protein [Victivallales bacterium]